MGSAHGRGRPLWEAIAAEVVHRVYVKVIYILRCALHRARADNRRVRVTYRSLRAEVDRYYPPGAGPDRLLEARFREARSARIRSDRAFEALLLPYRAYRDFLSVRRGLPPGTRWAGLAAVEGHPATPSSRPALE